MRSYYFIFFLVILSLTINAQTTIKEYAPDDTVIPNPERGFYHHTEVSSSNYRLLNQSTLEGYRQNESITQILRVFYLEDFKDGPISQAYLNNMRRDFSIIRKAGLKAIIRFAYTKKSTAPFGDAPLEKVLIHIDQLKPILQENEDVIATVQAGFVGAWGEWYYTDHFSEIIGGPTDTDWANRRNLVFSLLDAVPESRAIQLRTPNIKTTLIEDNEALTQQEAFSSTAKARLGHHNDCFVASSSDFGTYINPSVEKPYLEQETRFLPMGGETCAIAPPYSDCEFASSELERFHYSYLNIDYNTDVLDIWGSQGCFEEVELRLGYRYQLQKTTATAAVKPGDLLEVSIDIQSMGYSNPYNKRLLELVLINKISREEYYLPTPEDPRLWPIASEFTLNFEGGIPAEIPTGEYELILNLPDPMPALYGKPSYSIRFANQNTWEPNTGYNKLGIDIKIIENTDGVPVSDQDFFRSRLSENGTDLDIEPTLRGGANNQEIMLFWSADAATLTRVIERAEGDDPFEPIAHIPANLEYFTDFDAQLDNIYQYRFKLVSGKDLSPYSDTLTTSLNGGYAGYTPIQIDGNDSDWAAIPPLMSNGDSGFKALRTVFDANTAFFIFYGKVDSYEIYLDTDNDQNTGNQFLQGSGFDYLIKDDSLFGASNGSWLYNEVSLTTHMNDNLKELQLKYENFVNMGENLIINIATKVVSNNNEVFLSSSDKAPVTYYRGQAPDTPLSLEIRKSNTAPQSMLQLNWSECEYCIGYQVERSRDGLEFSTIAMPLKNTTTLNDDNLEDQTSYFYRISSYNELGFSTYSAIVSETTGDVILSVDDEEMQYLIYPNPAADILKIQLSEDPEHIRFFNLLGREFRLPVEKNQGIYLANIESLPDGIFFIQIEQGRRLKTYRVLKQ